MVSYTVFVVDDDITVSDGIAMALEENYRSRAFTSAEEAFKAMEQDPPDLILLDIGLPGMDGIQALRRIKSLSPETLVIMITGFQDTESVVSAMRLGAYDYVVKPLNMEGLSVRIQNALQTIELRKEVQSLQEKYIQEQIPCFIAESKAIRDVIGYIKRISRSPDTPVMVLGASGTGKELIAKSIHCSGPHFNGPFVALNCAAIPKELIESELFGYDRGAFSGAHSSGKKGLIAEAENGTLFLDEVGDLGLEAQAKLLRFLEDSEFYRLGGTKKIKIKTRVVSATNKNIAALIGQGLFREDLYYRLAVVRLEVPSLKDRREDILPIARYFLMQFDEKFGRRFQRISKEAEGALITHNWQGNVRELRNIIERAVLVGNGPELTTEDLGLPGKADSQATATRKSEFPTLPAEGLDLAAIQEKMEKHFIEEALRMTQGNEHRAAKLLRLNYHTFRYRKNKMGID